MSQKVPKKKKERLTNTCNQNIFTKVETFIAGENIYLSQIFMF